MKKNGNIVNQIVTDIKKYDIIRLNDFQELIKNYNKGDVLKAFTVVFNNLSKKEILNKYFDVFLYINIGVEEPSNETFKNLCLKYGEEKVISYLSQITSEFCELVDEIVESDDIIEEDYDEESEISEFSSSTTIYLNEINKFPLLTDEETEQLFVRYANGDNSARKKIIESNLRLVIRWAKYYSRYSNTDIFLDLIQEGNSGLMKAVTKFNPGKGYKFSTYASWWIRQAITRSLSEQSRTIRIPVHMVEVINKINKIERIYFTKNGNYPSIEELSSSTGYNIDLISKAKEAYQLSTLISLNAPTSSDDDADSISDFVTDENAVSPEETLISNENIKLLYKILDSLSERKRKVIELRFGFVDGRVHTLEEVGKELGVTRERVRQIEDNALRRIKVRYKQNEKELKLKDI